MVFKTIDGHLTSVFNKVEKINAGFDLTNDDVQDLINKFNNFNSEQDFGQGYEKFIKDTTNQNLNVSLMFQELAEKGASAKASIEGVYAAILDGNTKGFANVKSTMTLFNQAQQSGADNAKAFAKAVGQSNTQLGNYLGGLNGAKASLVGYGAQLAITTAKTIGLRAVTMALNTALSWGLSAGISALISWLDTVIVTEKELAEQAKETADKAKKLTDNINELYSAYTDMKTGVENGTESKENLTTATNNLLEALGYEGTAVDELVDKYGNLSDAINQATADTLKNSLPDLADAVDTELSKLIEKALNHDDALHFGFDITADDQESKELLNFIKEFDKENGGVEFQVVNSLTTRIDFEGDRTSADGIKERLENMKALRQALFDKYGAENAQDLDIYKDISRRISELEDAYSEYDTALDEYNNTAAKAQIIQSLVGKEIPQTVEEYKAYRQELIKSAQASDQYIGSQEDITNSIDGTLGKMSEFEAVQNRLNNLDLAKSKFGISDTINSATEGMKLVFINSLDDADLDILVNKIEDPFKNGIEGAKKAIADFKADPNNKISVETDTKSIDDMLKAVEGYSKSANTYVKNQKTVTDALEEQSKYGKLASDTVIELSDAGYASALVYDKETGAITLNKQAVENLNLQKQSELKLDLIKEKSEIEQKYNDEATAVAELQREMATANETRREAIRLEIAEKSKNMAEYYEMMSQYEGLINSINNYTPTQSDGSSKSSDPWKDEFEKEYNKKQHLLNMNQITEEEYIDWLDGAYKQYFSDLTKYQDEYNKYEEEVYKARSDREQKLFDKKIDNLEKLADKALDDKIEIPNANKELEEFNKKMQSEYGLGNVDLTKRPKVAMDDGSTATVLSSSEFLWQGDEENGEYVAVHYTPILPDGTILDDDTLAKYLYETLEGSDDILKADTKGLVLKVDTGLGITDEDFNSLETDNPTRHIQDIIKACDDWDVALHNIQEQWLDVSATAENATTTATNKFDYARDQINKAITETQARIDGIRNGTISGDTDDIEALIDDLDSLNDKLIDINKKEIESEKDYISELKDDYSDMMDERIDKVEELSDKIEDSYDKQIDTLEKIKDTEDRIKKIKDAQLEVKEKEKALDEAKREDAKNSYVYFDGAGMSVQTSTENQQKAQQELEESRKDLEEAYREEEINVLKEQKEAATTYYDNVKDNLEKQKTQGEKTYEAVEKIYEQLSGDKKQTSSNAELVKKLSKSGDISKAMSELSDTERQKVIDTGVVKVQPNGDYTFDYFAFEKYSSTVDNNTLATQDLTSILKDIVTQADIDNKDKTDNSMVAGGFNLVADPKTGKLTKKQVMVNGEVVEGLGHKVYATSKEEWQEHNNREKTSKGSFAGYNTFIDFMRAVSAGKVDISPLTNAFNSGYNPLVDKMNKSVSDTINNVSNSNVNNVNNKPVVNLTVNVEGSADKKTVEAFRDVVTKEIGTAFDEFGKAVRNAKV